MPNRTQIKQNKKKTRNNAQSKRKAPKRRKQPLSSVARMLLDPCNAPLVHGLHATQEGILSSLRTTFESAYADTSGYIIWFPDYATNGTVHSAGYRSGNCFVYTTADPALHPANNPTNPFGAGPPGGNRLKAGASAFISSPTVSTYRLVSACVEATYTGTLLDSKGLITPLVNISTDNMLHGGPGSVPASVLELVAMSTGTSRLGTKTHQVRSRPNSGSPDDFIMELTTPLMVGDPGYATKISNEARVTGPLAIGFAWVNVPSDQINFRFTQNIEWTPDATAGFAVTVPKQLHSQGYLSQLLAKLDRTYPGWQTHAAGALKQSIYDFAYSGARNRLLR